MKVRYITYQVAIAINSEKSIFDYKSVESISVGQIVEVTLRSKRYLGVVLSFDKSTISKEKIIPINEVLFGWSLSNELIDFLKRLSEYTMYPLGGFLRLLLQEKSFYKKEYTKLFKLREGSDLKKLPSRWKEIVSHVHKSNNLCLKTNLEKFFSKHSIRTLVKKHILEESSVERVDEESKFQFNIPNLSDEQNSSYKNIISKFGEGFSPILFFGVTGSGKTEVYLKLIESILQNKESGQFLIMVPEIMLTNSMVNKVKQRVGKEPLVWHSGISIKRKKEIFRRISCGNSEIILGARSALFLPYKKLSLVIVDEEHDQSYKQEESIIYNARDAGVLLSKVMNIPIILCSGTPSLESFYNARTLKYEYVELKSRFNKVQMPNVVVEDLHSEKLPLDKYLSNKLLHQISREISAGKQALLFLNRKGFSPVTICGECNFLYKCQNCSINLVYHKSKNLYICHYCGYSENSSDNCPSCKATDSLRFCGPGIEKLFNEVKSYFSDKNIAILSSDHLSNKNYTDVFEDISSGKTNIIIGTQIISKGYHFKNLSLVGVIDADLGVLDADLRSAERSFQVVNQVVGRAGREFLGSAIIQTYFPQSPMIQSIMKNDIKGFYLNELNLRKQANLPPFSRLIALIVSSADKELLLKFLRVMKTKIMYSRLIDVLGPIESPIFKMHGKFRYRFLVKSSLKINLQQYIREWLKNVKIPSNIRLKIDVDPYNFL